MWLDCACVEVRVGGGDHQPIPAQRSPQAVGGASIIAMVMSFRSRVRPPSSNAAGWLLEERRGRAAISLMITPRVDIFPAIHLPNEFPISIHSLKVVDQLSVMMLNVTQPCSRTQQRFYQMNEKGFCAGRKAGCLMGIKSFLQKPFCRKSKMLCFDWFYHHSRCNQQYS